MIRITHPETPPPPLPAAHSVITLNEVLAAAAFGLATRATNTKAVTTPMATPMAGNSNDVEDAEDDVIDLPYDESSISLPPWFAEAWNRSRDPGCDRLDIRKVLENLPYPEEVPRRPQDNNHNNDGKQYLDKTVKSWQQKLLHGLRIIGNISVADSDSSDTYERLLQAFHLLSDLEQSICDFRKTSSIKGSVAHSNQLFKCAVQTIADLLNIGQVSVSTRTKGGLVCMGDSTALMRGREGTRS